MYTMCKSIEAIKDAQYPIIMAPFNGVMVPVKLRKLTGAQILSCGNFSLIETFNDKVYRKSHNFTFAEMKEYSKMQHALISKSLVSPTYDELIKEVFEDDQTVINAKVKLKELNELLATANPGPQKSTLQREIDELEMWANYVLPYDFLAYVTAFALDVDSSDIKLMTEDILLNSAIMATKGHDNPADHIDGNFTKYNLEDINRRAWLIYEEWKERNKKGK